jgi:hypothetical protein
VALRTVDWPVLSGLHAGAGGSGQLWTRFMQRSGQLHARQQQHSSPQATLQQWRGRRAGAGDTPAAAMQQAAAAAPAAAAPAAGPRAALSRRPLNDAAVLVPPEYLEVCTCGGAMRGVVGSARRGVLIDVAHPALLPPTACALSLCAQVDECAERVLVLGWGPMSLMVDLLRELDHGLSALPPGSEVVFVNVHSRHDSLGHALQLVSLDTIQVRWCARAGRRACRSGPAADACYALVWLPCRCGT